VGTPDLSLQENRPGAFVRKPSTRKKGSPAILPRRYPGATRLVKAAREDYPYKYWHQDRHQGRHQD